MVDLNLPGLSGKDLMVALASQGIQAPLIVIAQRGTEADIIQTFRLGAADYLLLPVREAEVVNAVSRVLQQVHDRRERDRLAQQLQQANQEMQSRVRELTTIFAVGKAMTSITDQAFLMDKILDAALRITQGDLGWFLLRDEPKKPFIVAAEKNLPAALGVNLNQPWDDGISSLVAMSGELFSVHGDPLRRFKISALGQSALIVPIRAQQTVIGLLVMMRKAAVPFGSSEQHILQALADYASISLVNARLFRTLDERARLQQQMADFSQLAGKVNNHILQQVKDDLSTRVSSALAAVEQLAKDPTARWRSDQRQQLAVIQGVLFHTGQVASAISPLQPPGALPSRTQFNLVEVVGQALRRLQPYAYQAGISFSSESPAQAVPVRGDENLTAQALDGLISQVVRLSKPGGQVILRVEKLVDSFAQVTLRSTSLELSATDAEKILDEKYKAPVGDHFGGLGVQLSLVKDILVRQEGKIWLENSPEGVRLFRIRLLSV
jgi:K+-sensing histidine kinase KdpD